MCIRDSDKHVADRTGFNIRTQFKTHRLFIHTVVDYQTEVLSPLESGLFMETGDCILLALGRLTNKSSDASCVVNALLDTVTDPPKTRKYRDCAEAYDCVLVPTTKPLLRGKPSQWLLHCEAGGRPHCVAIEVLDGETCTIFHGSAKSRTPIKVVDEVLSTCIDRRLLMWYRVYPKSDPEHGLWKRHMSNAASAALLDLCAGAGTQDPSSSSRSCPIPTVATSSEDSSVEDEPSLYPREIVYDKDDETKVHVDLGLYHNLLAEVLREVSRVSNKVMKCKRRQRLGRHTRMACRFCLFTDYPLTKSGYKAYLLHLNAKHIPCDMNISDVGDTHKDESAFYSFIPKNRGGSRQLLLIKALFDNDSLDGKIRQDYLWTSTTALAKIFTYTVAPRRHKCYGRYIHIKLSHDGPHLFTAFSAADTRELRRVGNFYYDESFANAFFREALVVH